MQVTQQLYGDFFTIIQKDEAFNLEINENNKISFQVNNMPIFGYEATFRTHEPIMVVNNNHIQLVKDSKKLIYYNYELYDRSTK